MNILCICIHNSYVYINYILLYKLYTRINTISLIITNNPIQKSTIISTFIIIFMLEMINNKK